jgi:hypothetical protein
MNKNNKSVEDRTDESKLDLQLNTENTDVGQRKEDSLNE